VENLDYILKCFQASAGFNKLEGFISNDNYREIRIKGLAGSQLSFLICASQRSIARYHVILAEDKEQAAFLFNNLENILQKQQIWFLPDSFKRPGIFEELNNTNVLQRAETINQMSSGLSRGNIMVSYPEALFERVVSPETLKKTRIEIGVNERLDLNFLIEVLAEYGFESTDFVYEPGQFSLRGGIIDIFSYGNDMPYRIELFDDIIERIRIFDPMD